MTLSQYLESREISPSEFASLIGVTRAAVSNWVRGERVPKAPMMRAITQATKGAVRRADFNGGNAA